MKKTLKILSLSVLLAATSTFALYGCSNIIAKEANLSASSTEDQTKISPTYRDVVIATVNNDNGDERELKMNIFKPNNSEEKVPVLVYIHGGGWAMGDYECDDALDKEEAETSHVSTGAATDQIAADSAYMVFKRVLNSGIAFVSVDYRLNSEAAFPAQIHDVKGAVRYLRAHAEEYGFDTERIAVAGNSAGGHLALELATTSGIEELEGDVGGNLEYSSDVMACVDFYGPTDLLTMSTEMDPSLQSQEEAIETHDSISANESILLGFTGEGQGVGVLREIRDNNQTDSLYWDKVKLAELASPINNVTSDDPPVFISHGGSDSLVPIQQSLRLREALNREGVENIFISNSKGPHGSQGEQVNNAAITWITDKLLSK